MKSYPSKKELLPVIQAMDTLRRIQKERKRSFPKLIVAKKIDRPTANHRYLCFDNALAEINWFTELDKNFKREFPGQFKQLDEVLEEVQREHASCQAEYAAREMPQGEMKYRMKGFEEAIKTLKLLQEGKTAEVKAMGEQLEIEMT